MIIDLLKGKPLIIPGEPVAKANIQYPRTKGMPANKIKNPRLRRAKEQWDMAMAAKDITILSLRSEINKRGWQKVDRNMRVWTSIVYFFEYKKSINEADLIKDVDNAEKLLADCIQESGIIPNDCQIVFRMLAKQVVKENPRIEIMSMAASDSWVHFMEWIKFSSDLTARRILEHQLSLL